MCLCSESGQATVEAAFVLPLLFVVLGLFMQPMLLLYDSCVMGAAAAETCRALQTNEADAASVREYALRRLGAIPQAPVFHVGGDAGWGVELEGSELSGAVEVTISHEFAPLPLFGVTAGLGGEVQADGTVAQKAQAVGSLQPAWAQGADVDAQIAAWD